MNACFGQTWADVGGTLSIRRGWGSLLSDGLKLGLQGHMSSGMTPNQPEAYQSVLQAELQSLFAVSEQYQCILCNVFSTFLKAEF